MRLRKMFSMTNVHKFTYHLQNFNVDRDHIEPLFDWILLEMHALKNIYRKNRSIFYSYHDHSIIFQSVVRSSCGRADSVMDSLT